MPPRVKMEVEELRLQILELLVRNGPMTRAEILKRLTLADGQTDKTVQNLLQRLKMKGTLVYSLDGGTWRMAGTSPQAPIPPQMPKSVENQEPPPPPVEDVPRLAPPARQRAAETPTAPSLAPAPSDGDRSRKRAQAWAKERLQRDLITAHGGIVVDVQLVLAPREVLELADRLPQVMQAAAALV